MLQNCYFEVSFNFKVIAKNDLKHRDIAPLRERFASEVCHGHCRVRSNYLCCANCAKKNRLTIELAIVTVRFSELEIRLRLAAEKFKT